MDKLKIFSGNANLDLSMRICHYLGVELGDAHVSTFSDGEIRVEINENVRGKDVFVIQPTCPPVNHNLMELLIMIDALRRASARRITAVIPYYGYARQDRKVAPRAPISAKLVADLLTVAGTSRVLALDLHAGQIQGFFNIPVDNLYALPVQLEYLRSKKGDFVVLSPDAGGVERARELGKRLKAQIAIVDKRREGPNVSKVMHIVGDVRDKDVIIVDDMIDTGGTIVQAAEAVLDNGARSVLATCSHPVLSGDAVEKIRNSRLLELAVTNSIPLNNEARALEKIRVLDVSSLFGEAIKRIHNEESVSALFV
jgi:ribose-phosphate pyrophosphokinase